MTAEDWKELEREQVEWDKLHRGEIYELPEWLKARLAEGWAPVSETIARGC
jgi:hypothetical protein